MDLDCFTLMPSWLGADKKHISLLPPTTTKVFILTYQFFFVEGRPLHKYHVLADGIYCQFRAQTLHRSYTVTLRVWIGRKGKQLAADGHGKSAGLAAVGYIHNFQRLPVGDVGVTWGSNC